MATFGVILLCLLAGMNYVQGRNQALDDDSEMPREIKTIVRRVNASKVVNNSKSVYLAKLSGKSSIFKNLYCVRSEYLSYDDDNKTTYRTLQALFKNEDNTSIRVSANISLEVQPAEKVYPPTLIVHLLNNISGLLPNASQNDFAVQEEYELPVLYAAGQCLILRNSKEEGPDSGCSLWIPGEYNTKPPFCCLFIYALMCEPTHHTYKSQCPNPNSTAVPQACR
uniref:Lipocalin n=1 Tax=Amblyomma parvum TaxID=251391 RepID=A0A023G1M1_AMBPA